MAKEYYKLAELIQAISAYEPPQRQAPLKTSLHARVRIGGSGTYLEQRLKEKSPAARAYTIKTLVAAMERETDPYRRLLYHNVMLRVNFSYGAFLKAANALRDAELLLVERHASWYSLYVHRFTRMQALTPSQWSKSGYLLRAQHRQIVEEARRTYAGLGETLEAHEQPPTNQPHILIAMSEFLDENHPLTKQAVDLGDALVRNAGAKVSILNVSIPPRLPISYFGDHTLARVVDGFSNISTLEHGSHAFAFAQNPNMIANLASFTWYARHLAELNPTGVITIGPGNIIADTFAQSVPTLAFPNIGEVPLSAAPIQCSASQITPADKRLIARAGTDTSGVHEIATAFRLPASAGPRDRRSFGFPETAQIALVVGMRLETECSDQFLSILERAAAKHPDLHLVFAGPLMQPGTWLKNYPALAAKSKLLEYQEDVLAITQACDVYVNPFRQGGGTSAIHGVSEGLPVVSRAQGDVAEIFGAEHCAASQDGFATLLDKTLTDGATFKRLSDQARKRWAVKSDMARMTAAITDLLCGDTATPYKPNAFVVNSRRLG